jgi:hypothetical protein
MATMFSCPSPRGTNRAGLFLNSRGELMDRKGNYWGRSQIMALDAAMASSVPKKPHNPLASGARNDFDSALKELCGALGLETEEVAGQVGDIIDEHERKQIQEYAASLGGGVGAGALDKSKRGAGAIDDAEVEERVRKLLADKGLDDDVIEEALEKVRADRAAAKDRLPVNALEGGREQRELARLARVHISTARRRSACGLKTIAFEPQPDLRSAPILSESV